MENTNTSLGIKKPLSMHPKRFALWLFIVSIVMLFAALTSAYIVRQADGNWFVYHIPAMFYYSTTIIILSSATMQWAMIAAKQDNIPKLKLAITLTAVLGVIFLVLQYLGWGSLVNRNVYLVGNPSGSFFYIITGLHGLHIVSGVIYLLITLFAAYKCKIHSKSIVYLEMCATFWHFLGILWIYLLIFLLINR